MWWTQKWNGVMTPDIASEDGQDLVEYSLLLVFIALVCIAGVTTLGTTVIQVYLDRVVGMFS